MENSVGSILHGGLLGLIDDAGCHQTLTGETYIVFHLRMMNSPGHHQPKMAANGPDHQQTKWVTYTQCCLYGDINI